MEEEEDYEANYEERGEEEVVGVEEEAGLDTDAVELQVEPEPAASAASGEDDEDAMNV